LIRSRMKHDFGEWLPHATNGIRMLTERSIVDLSESKVSARYRDTPY